MVNMVAKFNVKTRFYKKGYLFFSAVSCAFGLEQVQIFTKILFMQKLNLGIKKVISETVLNQLAHCNCSTKEIKIICF
jgi:hypothetical protein